MRNWQGKKSTFFLPFGIIIPNPCSKKKKKEGEERRREGEGENQLKKRIKHLRSFF